MVGAGLWQELLELGETGGWILCQGLEKGASSSPCLEKWALEVAGRGCATLRGCLQQAEGGRRRIHGTADDALACILQHCLVCEG